MADEDQTIEDILEARNATPGSLGVYKFFVASHFLFVLVMNPGDPLIGGVSSDFSSLAGEYLGDGMSQDGRSEKIQGPQKRRESALSLPPLQPTRSPLFFTPLDTLRNVLKPRYVCSLKNRPQYV
jgi:hypothetical protein